MNWEILIDGVSRKFTRLNFMEQLSLEDMPTDLTATVEYDPTNPVDFFDEVIVKRGGNIKWRGYVVEMEISWDVNGRYLDIYARDISILLWKKYIENFVNAQEGTKGFFGRVNAKELIKFLLRCPCSDSVHDYPSNKEGWGLAPERIFEIKADRTGYGDIEYAILRKRGMGWRNSGDPSQTSTLNVNEEVSRSGWEAHGSPPYLDADDGDTNRIRSTSLNGEAVYKFQALPSDASLLEGLSLSVVWRPDGTYWWWIQAETHVYIAVEGKFEYFIGNFGGRSPPYDNPWRTYTFNLDHLLDQISVDDLKNRKIKVKFVNKSDNLSTNITHAYLSVIYTKAGNQQKGEQVKISFSREKITGIYIESRMDNDSYPRNYKIYTWGDKETISQYTVENDPNGLINPNEQEDKVYVLAQDDQEAWLARDYGENGIDDFDWTNGFKVFDARDPTDYGPTLMFITNKLDAINELDDDPNAYYIEAHIETPECLGGEPDSDSLYFQFRVKDTTGLHIQRLGAITMSRTNPPMFKLRIQRSGDKVTFRVYDDEDKIKVQTTMDIDASVKFRYKCISLFWNFSSKVTDMNWWNDQNYVFHSPMSSEEYLDLFDKEVQKGSASRQFEDEYCTRCAGGGCLKITNTSETGVNDLYFIEKLDSWGINPKVLAVDFALSVEEPPHENVNTDLGVDGCNMEHQDWTHANDSPWLNDCDEDSNYILNSINPENEGEYDSYWTFENLNSKYEIFEGTVLKPKIQAKLVEPPNDTVYVNVKVYLWKESTQEWIDCGVVSVDTTSYQWYEFNDVSDSINSLSDINNLRIKIEFYGVGWSGDEPSWQGSIRITCAKVHVEGTAWWGKIHVLAIYDDSIYGEDPSTGILGGIFLKPVLSGSVGKWQAWIYSNEGGYWDQYGTTLNNTGYKYLRLIVKTGSGDGFVKLYESSNGTNWSLATEKIDLNNASGGNPRAFRIGAKYYNFATGSIWLDTVKARKHPNKIKLDLFPLGQAEIILAEVTNNQYRDIIHSWKPEEMDSIIIEITGDDPNHSWAISQIYIYKAPPDEYRVLREGDENLPYQYLEDVVFVDDYSAEIGPLNIKRGRLLSVLSKLVQRLHENYQPFECWINFSDKKVYIGKRRGSDKTATVTFEVGKHILSSTYTKTIDGTHQRVQVVGTAEGKRQEKVSSGWIEDTQAMNNINTFFEEIISEKTLANPDEAKQLAQIALKTNASPKYKLVLEISNDTYADGLWEIGDDVYVIDNLSGWGSNEGRIKTIRWRVDEVNGEMITLYLGEAFKTDEQVWRELFERLKTLEIAPSTTADWMDEGVTGEKIDVNKLTSFFSRTAQNAEFEAVDDSDPIWEVSVVNNHGATWKCESKTIGLYGPDSGDQYAEVKVRMAKRIKYEDPETGDKEYEYFQFSFTDDPKMTFEAKAFKKLGEGPFSWKEGDYAEVGFRDGWDGDGFFFRIVKRSGDALDVYADTVIGGIRTNKKIRTITMNRRYKFVITCDSKRNWVIFDVYDVEAKAKYPISAVRTHIPSNIKVNPFYAYLSAYGNKNAGYRAILYIYQLKVEGRVLPEVK